MDKGHKKREKKKMKGKTSLSTHHVFSNIYFQQSPYVLKYKS